MSSLENPEQNPLESAVDLKEAEKFDAKGNLRTLRTIPETGVTALMSQEEYEEALEGGK